MDPEKKYYSYLQLNVTTRAAFVVVLGCVWFGVTLILIQHLLSSYQHWMVTAFMCTLASLPAISFPLVETWVYQPWQAKARKYEHHHKERG